MGLPLFVAPVKSDVARKPSHKNAATSPSRSSIRRSDRPADRERRMAAARRAVASTYLGPNRRYVPTGSQERPPSWPDAGVAQGVVSSATSSVVRLRSAEQTHAETDRRDAQRGRREENMPSGRRHDPPAPPPAEEHAQDTDLGWWSIDSRGRVRRPRVLTPISSRFTRSPDTLDSERTNASGSLVPAQQEASLRNRQFRLAHLARHAYVRRQNQDNGGNTGVDGLGDRDRSLSPEGWDTLFTTLAPDPQAPNASTSFASDTGAQDAGQLDGNSILPDGFDDAPIDTGCDSGCEHSDAGDAVLEESRQRLYRQRREYLRQSRMLAGYRDHRNNDEGGAQLPPSWHSGRENGEAPGGLEERALNRLPMPAAMSDGNGQDSWLRRALMGANEVETTDDGTGNITVTALSNLNSAPGEEDLAGMQRIFRNLARREDIPDEWWAEAGLSRSLSRQGGN